MKLNFVRLSDLKAKAKKEVKEYEDRNKHFVIPSFFGHPATNIEWYKKAMNFYEAGLRSSDVKKGNYLMNALIDIYKCDCLMSKRKFNDERVTIAMKKIETSYLNFILNFINSNINDNEALEKNQELLSKAICVLEESNSKLAQRFTLILRNFQSGQQKHAAIIQHLQMDLEAFSKITSTQINLYFRNNAKFYSDNPQLLNDLYDSFYKKINDLYHYYQQKIKEEEREKYPSIKYILGLISKFQSCVEPLNILLENKYKKCFNSLEKQLQCYQNFIESVYPVLKKTYSYLSLPHENLNIKRILTARNLLKEYHFPQTLHYQEFIELVPSIEKIKEEINNQLDNHFRSDINQYLKFYNDISDIEDFETKFIELRKLKEVINTKIKDDRYASFIQDDFSEMMEEIELESRKLLLEQLINEIKTSESDEQKRNVFDQFFEKYLLLNDSDLLKALKKTKNEILHNNSVDIAKVIKRFFSDEPLEDEESEIQDIDSQNGISDFNRLILIDNFTLKNYVFFLKNSIYIGRSSTNDIVLPVKWVSARHAKLDLANDLIIDLDSTNGTFANSEPISKATLLSLYSVEIANIFAFDFFVQENSYQLEFSHLKNKFDEIDLELVDSLKETSFIVYKKQKDILINSTTGKLISNTENTNHFIISPQAGTYQIDGKTQPLQEGLIQLNERFTLKI